MIETALQPQAIVFSIALAIVFGLFLLEIVSLILGGSLLAIDGDGPDLDADFDIDVDMDVDLDTDFGVEGSDGLMVAPSGFWGWTGIKDVPFLIWLISFLVVFGLSGLVLQSVFHAVFGVFVFGIIAYVVAGAVALVGAKSISAFVAAIMPKDESSAMRKRFLGGHHGVISQGTAKRGKPAEAKIKDRFGNTHYLRVEPLDDDGEIPQGRTVHVIRKKSGMFYVVDIT